MQEEKNLPPLQLLLDMKVRWSSTYVMLNRAENRREVTHSSTFKDISISKSLFR
jgi:hypothetical protein